MCPPYILDGTYVHKNFAANDFKQLTEEEESRSHAISRQYFHNLEFPDLILVPNVFFIFTVE